MIVLHRNHDQLIIGADTRKIALLLVGGFILISVGIYALLSNSSVLAQENILPVALGLIGFLSLFVGYYFFRVFRTAQYFFDKKASTLQIKITGILGQKNQTVPLDHITKVEMHPTPVYDSVSESVVADGILKRQHAQIHNVIVLSLKNKSEINLTPNAGYFFLHPFEDLNAEINNGLGEKIAAFLGIPLVEVKSKTKKLSTRHYSLSTS
jgi:hypothetical protein